MLPLSPVACGIWAAFLLTAGALAQLIREVGERWAYDKGSKAVKDPSPRTSQQRMQQRKEQGGDTALRRFMYGKARLNMTSLAWGCIVVGGFFAIGAAVGTAQDASAPHPTPTITVTARP